MQVVTNVAVVDGFWVRLAFADRSVREVDLEPLLRGPIFAEIRKDPELFQQVFVDEQTGTIAWPNGADMDADVLHGDEVPAWSTPSH